LSTIISSWFLSENDFFLDKPYYGHKGPLNRIFLFEASHTTVQIITTKPKFVCLLRTVFKVIPPTMSKNVNSCCWWYDFWLALMVNVLLQIITLSVVGFEGTTCNMPHNVSISIFIDFPTNLCENMNPIVGSNSGQRTIIMCFYVDVSGSCFNSNTIMFMCPSNLGGKFVTPLWDLKTSSLSNCGILDA
jgi:hypothetical protein